MKKQNLENPCGATLSEGATFRSIENDSSDNINNCHLNFNEPKNKKGFTLAETLITLTILGIVAAITIPALINRQQEAANRTKVKKAMTMYEKALNQMIIENDLKTNQSIIDFGAEGGACANTTEYFKKVEEKTPCRFKTADRIWWDITDIENPLIILNDKKKDETIENLQALAKDTNDITTYAMIGRLDETTNAGIVRINDNAFEQANGTDDQKAYMSKLYGFVNSKANNVGGGVNGNTGLDGDDNIDVPSNNIAGTAYSSLSDFPTCTDEPYQGCLLSETFYFSQDGTYMFVANSDNSYAVHQKFGPPQYTLSECDAPLTNCRSCSDMAGTCPANVNGVYNP